MDKNTTSNSDSGFLKRLLVYLIIVVAVVLVLIPALDELQDTKSLLTNTAVGLLGIVFAAIERFISHRAAAKQAVRTAAALALAEQARLGRRLSGAQKAAIASRMRGIDCKTLAVEIRHVKDDDSARALARDIWKFFNETPIVRCDEPSGYHHPCRPEPRIEGVLILYRLNWPESAVALADALKDTVPHVKREQSEYAKPILIIVGHEK